MSDIPTLTEGESSTPDLLAQAASGRASAPAGTSGEAVAGDGRTSGGINTTTAPTTTAAPVVQPAAVNPIGSTQAPQANAEVAAQQAATETKALYTELKRLLSEAGLDGLYDTVYEMITSDMGTAEQILLLEEQPLYQNRFRAVFERRKAGLPPTSAAEVLAFEKELAQQASLYGYPLDPGENMQDLAADLMIGDTSMSEAVSRMAATVAYGKQVLEDPNMDQEIVQQILGMGVSLAEVGQFALDPSKTLDQIERRLAAAGVANEAAQSGYRLGTDEALELARQGVDGQQAQQAFGVLNQNRQVVDSLIGDNGDPVSRQQELAAVAGDVEAQAAIERSRQTRVAAFQVGGQFATDEDGFAGLR